MDYQNRGAAEKSPKRRDWRASGSIELGSRDPVASGSPLIWPQLLAMPRICVD